MCVNMQISTEELIKALVACTTLEALCTFREALDSFLTPEQHALIFDRMTAILLSFDDDDEDDNVGEDSLMDDTVHLENNRESTLFVFLKCNL